MAWIETTPETDADGELARRYRRYQAPSGQVDNIVKIHSLNPPSMDHHLALYEHLMRGPSGLSKLEREILAVAVSWQNECHY